jgi:lysozyme
MPGKWKKHTFWQFTGAGHVSGITGQVDRNLFNGSMVELKKLAKL